jgi:hypothetical protein
MTSLGPSRECYKPSRKSRGRPAETADAPAAGRRPVPAVPAERMRATLSATTGATTLLQRTVPKGGTGVVAVEGPGELSGHGGGQTEAQRTKPALPRARQEPQTTSRRSRSRRREGNHSEVFSMPVVTGLAVTRGSCASGAHRCSISAHTSASVRWSASGNASDTGNGHAPDERNTARGDSSRRWEWHRQLAVTY